MLFNNFLDHEQTGGIADIPANSLQDDILGEVSARTSSVKAQKGVSFRILAGMDWVCNRTLGIVQLGIGGYIASRGVEKVVKKLL